MAIRYAVTAALAVLGSGVAHAQDQTGCHGIGCQVDNPDRPANTGSSSSSSEMQQWEQSNKTSAGSTGDVGSSDEMKKWEASNDDTARSRPDDRSGDALTGSWTIGQRDGSERCSIRLSNDQVSGLRTAWTGPGCTGGLFGNNRWRTYGRNLDITDMGGTLVASFRRGRGDGFTGRRVSDGAPMYMSR